MDWNRFISPKSQGVEVSLTTYCNANCPLCARTDPFTGVKKESIPLLHISFDVYKKFVDEINQIQMIAYYFVEIMGIL